jgi:hypothetical protein
MERGRSRILEGARAGERIVGRGMRWRLRTFPPPLGLQSLGMYGRYGRDEGAEPRRA